MLPYIFIRMLGKPHAELGDNLINLVSYELWDKY